jgi:uncharacterized small protein (TIGR04563 family)
MMDMPATDNKGKQRLYLPEEMLREIEAESAPQDQPLSSIVQRARLMPRSNAKA